MAPQRKSEFSSIVVRALFTGACVSMINACLAGIVWVSGGQQQPWGLGEGDLGGMLGSSQEQ